MDKNEELLKALATVIRRLRQERGQSLLALSVAANIEKKYLFLIEKGQRNPSLLVCFSLAVALGISLDELCRLVLQEYSAQTQQVDAKI